MLYYIYIMIICDFIIRNVLHFLTECVIMRLAEICV